MIEKIISGGQTGVDRAALDVAMLLDLSHGGWCPKYRKAEDGEIPRKYILTETLQPEYKYRTEFNIRDSDGTLILNPGESLEGGTLLTKSLVHNYKKPLLIIDLNDPPDKSSFMQWIIVNHISCLNIAGPRESKVPGIYKMSKAFLLEILSPIHDGSEAPDGCA